MASSATEPEETEFPEGYDEPPVNGLDRRQLMQLMGAGAALAGLSSCNPTEKTIVPYARRPVGITPGIPLYYATSFVLDGFATGLIAESHEGRPTKLEGNPKHPASLGATGVYEQASILELYEPSRFKTPSYKGSPASWERALSAFAAPAVAGQAPPWFVLYPQSSPLVGSLTARIRKRHPGARFSFISPVSRQAGYAATRLLFGRALESHYDFTRARVVLSLDADFLASMPMSVRWARDFAARRRLSGPNGRMNRLYVAETMPSPTGSIADHHVALRGSELRELAATLLGELLATGSALPDFPAALASRLPPARRSPYAEFVRVLAADLTSARGACVVLAGDRQPLEVHVLVHALNVALGNLGQTVTLVESPLLEPEGGTPLSELVAAIQARAVGRVVILEGNPVYTAPAGLELGRWLDRAPETIHLTSFWNQTSERCHWVLPSTHYLESWGDARAYDGTISYLQPLIAPLVPAKSPIEILAAFAGDPKTSGHLLVRDFWRAQLGAEFEPRWESLLQEGFAADTGFPPAHVEPDFQKASGVLASALEPALRQGIELSFEQSPSVYDGRMANNVWLLELPHPVTKQSWGNSAMLAPRTALALGIENGDVVELAVDARSVRLPVLIVSEHAEHAVTVGLGYGQAATFNTGVNAFPLVPSSGAAYVENVRVTRTEDREALAITQEHMRLVDRPVALSATLSQYRKNPAFTRSLRGPLPTLLPNYPYSGTQWAMTIDTMICTGCSTCVVACQAENNIPVVGKDGVRRSREMYWLRIDRYQVGPLNASRIINQPMLCQHCENAPCEYVCPVNATVHSPDGLNEMVYNRCIGTRFCSNNCPYKVRRFNWFDYTDKKTTLGMQRNPQVTVRDRGVMEKCTFCVQRIRRTEQRARVEGRPLAPNEVVTACQQACPTGAIQFGSLDHERTLMVEWRKELRKYAVLHDQGTRPRVQYLADIRNPNPNLAG